MNINISISETISEFDLSREQTDMIVENVKTSLLNEIYRQWVSAASKELNSTRAGYIRGLQMHDEGIGKGSIVLTGVLNNMLENGASPFDMKEGFQKSPKVKYSKSGQWYLTIPFRYAAPGSLGESESFSGVLPQKIYNIIKTRAINKSGQATLQAKHLPTEFSDKKTSRAGSVVEIAGRTIKEYTHKSAQFEGLVRTVNKTTTGGTQSQYNTFRRVGAASDINSWINKGLQMRNLLGVALQNVNTDIVVNNAVDKALSEIL